MVAYESFQLLILHWEKFGVLDRRSLTRGSKFRVLSVKNLVFWIGGCLQEVPTIGF